MSMKQMALLIGVIGCFTGAVIAILVWQAETQKRSQFNISVLCTQLEEITQKPCILRMPDPARDAASERR